MNTYPEVVAKIIDDYVERLKSRLRLVPVPEQQEFLREIQSHIYEAYQAEDSAENDVTRILRVLRNLGEPAEVVTDRLPEAMVRSGAKRHLPLQILGGIFIALFGIPLGFGGVAVLMGVLATLVAIVVAYYAFAAVTLLGSVMFLSLGMTRLYQPELWDRFLASGIIQMDAHVADVLDVLSASDQGYLMILFAILLAATGLGLFWSGRYVMRGLRFLAGLVFDWFRQLAQRLGRREKLKSMNFVRRFQRA